MQMHEPTLIKPLIEDILLDIKIKFGRAPRKKVKVNIKTVRRKVKASRNVRRSRLKGCRRKLYSSKQYKQ